MILRKFVPGEIGLVVSVVITLNVRRMRAIRFVHHRIDDQTGNQSTIGIGADHRFVNQLFHHDDDMLRGESYFLLHAEEPPQLRIALRSARWACRIATSGLSGGTTAILPVP